MCKKLTNKKINIKNRVKKNDNGLKELHIKCNTILPNFIDKFITVYNGRIFKKVFINKNMVGYKIGEFIRTRKEFSFKKKKSGSKN